MKLDRNPLPISMGLFVLCHGFTTLLFVYNSLSSLLGLRPFPAQWEIRELVEAGTAVVLLATSVFITVQFWRTYKTKTKLQGQLDLTSNTATNVVHEQFEKWQLTASEALVATYILKGLSNREIAEITGKKEGTIKSQCNAVFRKSGLKNRSQLNSYFFEFLILESETSACMGRK
ncbi:MAG: helix-turn-helix transcriptional regulator [Paracoccaceae bacterium]